MAGISDLVNNITGSISGLIDDITGNQNSVINYPNGNTEYEAIQSQITPGNWSKLNFPYTFSVISLTDPSFGQLSGFQDFELPLAPQAISQKEEPAISIRPTQGGTTVNHSGLGYKQLSISGTTGIAPFRGEGGVNRATGEAIFQPKQLKYKSGYEVFLHLRNWFRTYYEFKKKYGSKAKDFRLVFKNYKDGEFLIVELRAFEMERNATRPFLYDYKLDFQVLSHFQFTPPSSKNGFLGDVDAFIEAAKDKIDMARGVFLRTQGILRQVESTYDSSILEPLRKTTLAIKALLGVPLVASDISSRTIVNTVSTAKALTMVTALSSTTSSYSSQGNTKALSAAEAKLDKRKGTLKQQLGAVSKKVQQSGSSGLSELGGLMSEVPVGSFPPETLAAASQEQISAANLPRSFYEETIARLERIKQNSEDFFNLGSTAYDSIFARTATLNADPSKVVTNDEYDMLNAFNEALTGLNMLLSTDTLFKSSFEDRVADMNARFNQEIRLVANQAVKQIKLPAGITLEKLAQREFGDSTRWGEIAEVNNLKAPYISSDPKESRDGVLKTGDNILIPTEVVNGFSSVPKGKENKLTKGMSEMERSLGVDLKVDKNFDLVLSSSGDLEIVAGSNNMAQAVILKLSYEPGDVMLYPTMGGGTVPGRKFPPLEELKDRVTTTLLQDPRIEKVADLSLRREGPGLVIAFNLFIKQVDIPVPVSIKV